MTCAFSVLLLFLVWAMVFFVALAVVEGPLAVPTFVGVSLALCLVVRWAVLVLCSLGLLPGVCLLLFMGLSPPSVSVLLIV